MSTKNKNYSSDWEWEKRPKKVEKGTNKHSKHRKNIYNMLSGDKEDFDLELDNSVSVSNNRYYVKR